MAVIGFFVRPWRAMTLWRSLAWQALDSHFGPVVGISITVLVALSGGLAVTYSLSWTGSRRRRGDGEGSGRGDPMSHSQRREAGNAIGQVGAQVEASPDRLDEECCPKGP